jgi:hypothetical protein
MPVEKKKRSQSQSPTLTDLVPMVKRKQKRIVSQILDSVCVLRCLLSTAFLTFNFSHYVLFAGGHCCYADTGAKFGHLKLQFLPSADLRYFFPLWCCTLYIYSMVSFQTAMSGMARLGGA